MEKKLETAKERAERLYKESVKSIDDFEPLAADCLKKVSADNPRARPKELFRLFEREFKARPEFTLYRDDEAWFNEMLSLWFWKRYDNAFDTTSTKPS